MAIKVMYMWKNRMKKFRCKCGCMSELNRVKSKQAFTFISHFLRKKP